MVSLRFVLITMVFLATKSLALQTPIQEFALPESLSSANAIALDRQGRVWFTEKVGSNLAMYDAKAEQFQVFPLPASWGKVGPSQIAITDQGEIWFTIHRWAEEVTETNVLGKFNPVDGSFVRHELSMDADPEEIIISANVLWFVATNRNSLFRVNLKDGKVSGYPIPTANSYPRGLAIGNDGEVWFSEANTNKIARFIPQTSLFKEYEIPTPFANPGEIAVDKEGRVWFVELTANRVAVYYPQWDRFDEAILPTRAGLPNSLVVDDSGKLWFLEYRGNKVGVFDPVQATFMEFEIPTFNSLPVDLVIDNQAGVIWFTESNTETTKLGRLSVQQALASGNNSTVINSANKIGSMGKVSDQGTLLSDLKNNLPALAMVFLLLLVVVAVIQYSRTQQSNHYSKKAREV